jgi:hypothetical protein
MDPEDFALCETCETWSNYSGEPPLGACISANPRFLGRTDMPARAAARSFPGAAEGWALPGPATRPDSASHPGSAGRVAV